MRRSRIRNFRGRNKLSKRKIVKKVKEDYREYDCDGEKQDAVVWKMVIVVWWHWLSSVGL